MTCPSTLLMSNSMTSRMMLRSFTSRNLFALRHISRLPVNNLYIQGQEPERGVREYFYYIDHQGMLFLDDAKIKNFTSCFKDKQFLTFFFRRIKRNNTGRYEEHFPFWSDCGKERNFIRGDDYPIVYTHIVNKVPRGSSEFEEQLCYGHVGDILSFKFQPQHIFMAESGRVYHPALSNAGSVGLISSKLAIELSKNFIFKGEDDLKPSHFKWNDQIYLLDSSWIPDSCELSRNV